MHILTFKVIVNAFLVIISLINSYKVIKDLVYPQNPSIKVQIGDRINNNESWLKSYKDGEPN